MNLYGDLTTRKQRVKKGFNLLDCVTYLVCMFALGMIIGHVYSVMK